MFIKFKNSSWLVLVLGLFSGITGCKVTNYLEPDEVWVTRNRVLGLSSAQREDVAPLLRHKPNRRFLGLVAARTWWDVRARTADRSDLSLFLARRFGESPNVFQQDYLDEGLKNLRYYLADKGYFRSRLVVSQRSTGQKKIELIYRIELGERSNFGDFTLGSAGDSIDPYLRYALTQPEHFKLKKGDPYDADLLDEQRTHLTTFLRNSGFYYVNKEMLYYRADTLSNRLEFDSTRKNSRVPEVNILLKVRLPANPELLRPYTVDHITVRVNAPTGTETKPIRCDSLNIDRNINVIDCNGQSLKPQEWKRYLTLCPPSRFSEQDIRLMQQRMSDLRIFSYTNLRLEAIDSLRLVRLFWEGNLATRRQLRQETEVSSSSVSLLGLALSISQTRRNLWRSAGIMEIKGNVGAESQQLAGNTPAPSAGTVFNTLELGLGLAISLPRLSAPIRSLSSINLIDPRSRLQLQYSRQVRPDFSREVLRSSAAWLWTNRVRERYELVPVEISLARTSGKSAYLDSLLQTLNDPFLRFSFTNYVNLASHISYTSDQLSKHGKLTRANIEFAGNLLSQFLRVFPSKNSQDNLIFGNTPYFRYVRSDLEYRRYFKQNNENILASRIFLGLGLPLGNSNILPLEKRYFSGGTNSIRAWLARSVGPGSFAGYGLRIDQFGECKLELNVEERFSIIGHLEGAFFIDAGNIWTLRDTTIGKSGLANFRLDEFYKEIAIGAGGGLRYDFDFFIIRLDLGVKLYDPAFVSGRRWVGSRLSDTEWKQAGWIRELNGVQANTRQIPGKYPFTSVVVGINYPF
jgi:outer membrane protein assembly factor BamA